MFTQLKAYLAWSAKALMAAITPLLVDFVNDFGDYLTGEAEKYVTLAVTGIVVWITKNGPKPEAASQGRLY